ncbi:hypothetical protein HPB49_010664 [Dermacentor silvarum]|uniref:Uncharacterized protein n=1 Tax=Dermacentor silvarum TaxID=543639 RepID=A0ACB8CEQ3_DERSI|nr:hypothetical protein HPB49_010664 [Dermacentor silvarum]
MAVLTPMILLLGVFARVCRAAHSANLQPLDVWYLGNLDSCLHGIRGTVYAASADTLKSFAHVDIPADLHLPRPMTVAKYLVGDHANASAVVIEDQKTLLLKNFYYDGSVPGTYFLVGKGHKPGPKGTKVLDEKGRIRALRRHAGANLRFTLPGNLTVGDIDWFAVYCTRCSKSLVQGSIPKRPNVPHDVRRTKTVKNDPVFGGRDIHGVKEFTATIGPTAGDHGYEKITGRVGWGISWWINGELIPVLHVKRGETYTFIVEGGNDKSVGARYHPFYITSSQSGGGSKVDRKVLGQKNHTLLAGVVLDAQGNVDVSKGIGRFCEYTETVASDEAKTMEDYKKSVKKRCSSGHPGKFTWTPDSNTPDMVFYQCFTHFYIGWKIMVTGDAHSSEESTGSGQAVRPGLPPLLFGCVVILPTLLIRREARDRRL